MSLRLKIDFDKTDLSLSDFANKVRNRRGLANVLGRAAANEFKRNFRQLAGKGNRLGGASTGYWRGAAEGTQFQVVSDSAVAVIVNQIGVRLHYLGGAVRPTTSKYLTIPNIPEAHGKRAREFTDLFVVHNKAGFPCALGRSIPGSDKPQIVFWLKKSVKHRADQETIPNEETLYNALRQTAGQYYARELGGRGA